MDELRFRNKDHGVQTVGVNFPKRIIEIIVTPYERETVVTDRGPRPVTEIFSRSAYDGINARSRTIRANRDHDLRRIVGKAIAFHPSREEGLVAELKIAQTELGDETLALADDDCLDASAGYRTKQGGETWEARDRVRVTKAYLGHIALVPEPAYEDARVLAVRKAAEAQQASPTPNLDVVKAWQLEDRYASLANVRVDV